MNREAEKLVNYLNRLPVDADQKNFPDFVVMFDEAHTLSYQFLNVQWTVSSVLESVIRDVKPRVFFVFLTTAGRVYKSPPPSRVDPSRRVQTGWLEFMSPFTATGLSHHSPDLKKNKERNTEGKQHTDLEAVTSIRWQSLQSRALQVPTHPVSSA
jgi:hypothetical protein